MPIVLRPNNLIIRRKKSAFNKESQSSAKLCDLQKYQGKHTIDHIDGITYKNYSVPGNGNCFFNCLSLAFHGDFSNAGYYRNIICQKIIHEWDSWKDLAFISHDLRVNSVTRYWQSMMHSNGWATNCEIKAACDLLNINIHTWLKGFRFNNGLHTYEHTYTMETYQSNQDSTFNVTLLLWAGHFTLLSEIQPIEMNPETSPSHSRETLHMQTQQQTAVTSIKRKKENSIVNNKHSKKQKNDLENNTSAKQCPTYHEKPKNDLENNTSAKQCPTFHDQVHISVQNYSPHESELLQR